MTNTEKEILCLNAIKSLSVAAKAMEVAAVEIARLQKEIGVPDLKVVENESHKES